MSEPTSGDGHSDPAGPDDAAVSPAAPPPSSSSSSSSSPSPSPSQSLSPSPFPPASPSPSPFARTPAATSDPDDVGPRHSAPAIQPEPRRHSRRWFLGGASATVLAGAGGVGGALLRGKATPTPNPAPAPLLAAIAAERALLADLDATTGGTATVRRALVQVRADHAAHLTALQGVAASFDAPTGTGTSTGPVPGAARTAAALRAAETQAAVVAAGRAATLDGRTATLLASIAACEAGHAELLT